MVAALIQGACAPGTFAARFTLVRPSRQSGVRSVVVCSTGNGARSDAPALGPSLARKVAGSTALALAGLATPLAIHAPAAAAPAVAVAAPKAKYNFNPNLISLPEPVRRSVDAGMDRFSDEICAIGDAIKVQMNDDWNVEDVWLIVFWYFLIAKGRRGLFGALAKLRPEDKDKSETQIDELFHSKDHLLRWLGGPMKVVLWGMSALYAHDVFGRVLKLDGAIDGLGFDLGMYAIMFGASAALATLRYFPRLLERGLGMGSVALRMVTTRVVTIGIAFITALQAGMCFGLPPSAILGLGGVGGLAIGLALKDIVSNLVGGTMVSILRPFDVGENIFIKEGTNFRGSSDPAIAEYNVREIGWYQTVLVAKDTKPVIVPNGYFMGVNVINVSRQTHRVLVLDFRVKYEDRALVYDIIDDFEQYLRDSPRIDSDAHPIRVNVTNYQPDHLTLNVEAHAHEVDLTAHYRVKSTVLMELMDILERHTSGVAYPTAVRLEHPFVLSDGAKTFEPARTAERESANVSR